MTLRFGAHAEIRLQQHTPGVLDRQSQLFLGSRASQQRWALIIWPNINHLFCL